MLGVAGRTALRHSIRRPVLPSTLSAAHQCTGKRLNSTTTTKDFPPFAVEDFREQTLSLDSWRKENHDSLGHMTAEERWIHVDTSKQYPWFQIYPNNFDYGPQKWSYGRGRPRWWIPYSDSFYRLFFFGVVDGNWLFFRIMFTTITCFTGAYARYRYWFAKEQLEKKEAKDYALVTVDNKKFDRKFSGGLGLKGPV